MRMEGKGGNQDETLHRASIEKGDNVPCAPVGSRECTTEREGRRERERARAILEWIGGPRTVGPSCGKYLTEKFRLQAAQGL